MVKKLFLALLTCLCLAPAWADDAFRNHRYSSFQATPVTNKSIVFIGNSITNMQPWAELFSAENVVNRGNSGAFSWEILENIQSFIAGRPAKCFIMVGTNDMNVAGYTPEAVVRNVAQCVKHIQKESPRTTIYIESVMPSTNGSRTVAKGQELNRQLKAMAAEMGVTFVDYFDALMGCTTNALSYDYLHPHVKGSAIWTDCVKEYVGADVEAVLPAEPSVFNGGAANSYGARASVFAQLPISSDDVLFIGDEFVHGGEWQELLGNVNVKNRGTGWGRWGPQMAFHTTCVPQILKGLATSKAPKQVLLMIGTQQLASSTADLTALETAYEACIEAVRTNAPSTKITLVSEIPFGTSATAINVQNLVPFNQWLQEKAAAMENVDYADLYAVLTDNNAAIAKYMDANQYVTGLGYQACARKLAEHIDGCQVMSEAEAEAHYALIAARKALSNAVDDAERIETGDKVGEYPEAAVGTVRSSVEGAYTLLANDGATIAELEAYAAALTAALEELKAYANTPSLSTDESETWYTMTAMRSPNVFFTKDATLGFVATATLDACGYSYWKLVEHDATTFDIVNYQGDYIVPTATHNVQLTLSQTRPATGWSLEACDAAGAFNVTAKVGSTNVNCALNLTGANKIYNWITGRESDPGNQIIFAEAEFDPADLEQPDDTYNVPFNVTRVKDGHFDGAQWWYSMKLKNIWYIYESNAEGKMTLDRTQMTLADDELWAFDGSDQQGYTIYNRKYGTTKVLAAPATLTGNGKESYVRLVDADNVPAGYETKWAFKPSTDIADKDGYYMHELSNEANKVNNNASCGYFVFWNGGADIGSTLLIELAEAVLPVGLTNGSCYRSDAVVTSGWCSTWKSTVTEPFQLMFGTSYNNMNAATMGIAVGSNSAPWNFTVSSQDYYVQAYSFKIKAGNNNQHIIPTDGDDLDILTSGYTDVSWQNDEKGQKTASFVFTGQNAEAEVTDMWATVRQRIVEAETQTNLFEYGSTGNNVCYRIPAIATTKNGNIIAVVDYRYGGTDIGFGRVSLRYRISKDNGQTWGEIKTLQESHQGQYGASAANDLWAGFGDPCIVADRESDRVLAMSCCGNVGYPGGTADHHQGIARFRSEDGGETWTTFGSPKYGIECHWEDIAEPIYQKFRDGGVEPAAMFVGSGRIFQSRFTKVGAYYRLYCVVLLRTASQGGLNYVLYSDDFGDTWDILGGDNFTYGVSGGDEPKAEELPDGSVLLSSRAYGRIFNIFHFSDVAKGEGSWMSQATSNGSNNGVREEGNACNGEIMILPVVRKSDNQKMWMALQSVPFGPGGRCNVGIYYKALDTYEKFSSPANLAKDWDGRHQASYMSSAYSTMTLQNDNSIGFLYEESTFGRDYTIVYKNYSIEQITDSTYTFDADPIAPFELTTVGIEGLTGALVYSDFVGGLKPEAKAEIDEAVNKFVASPDQENYINIFAVIAAAPRVELDPSYAYIIRNSERGSNPGDYAMCVNQSKKLMSKTYNKNDALQQWSLIKSDEGNSYYLYNAQTKSYVPDLPGVEVDIYTTTNAEEAGLFRLQLMEDDKTAMINLNPTSAGHPAIHAPAAYTTRMVAWMANGSPASQWYFEKAEIPAVMPTAIIETETPERPVRTYDLQGRQAMKPRRGVYIINNKKVVIK